MATFYVVTSVSGAAVTLSVYATAANANDKVETFDLSITLQSTDVTSNLTAISGNGNASFTTLFSNNSVTITPPAALGDTTVSPYVVLASGIDNSFGSAGIGDISGTTASGLVATLTVTLGSASSTLTGSVDFQDYTTVDGSSFTSGIPSIPLNVTACFAAGTRIAAEHGEVPVETLVPGMRVRLARGGLAEIVWAGHEHVACAAHAHPEQVMPVRIAAHAFGCNQPARDLVLSPDHAVFWNGVLVPARYLVNGATIVQQDVADIVYHHIELASHDVVLAENLPAETYLDTGNRGCFDNSDRASLIHPDLAMRIWDHHACARLVAGGPALRAIRDHLAFRAREAGWQITAAPDLRVVADGRVLPARAASGGIDVALPPGTGTVRLVSRSAVPAHVIPTSDDHRRLGAAITALRLDEAEINLGTARAGAGWHVAEPGLRWTNGNAELDVAGAARLRIAAAPLMRYWLPPAELARLIA